MNFKTVDEMMAYFDDSWKNSSIFYKARVISKRKYRTVRRVPREIRWKWQRSQRGWSEADAWSLDTHLTRIIVGGCKQLRESNTGYPSGTSSEEWNAILTEIIDGYSLALEDNWLKDEELKQFKKAQKLFNKWYFALWD